MPCAPYSLHELGGHLCKCISCTSAQHADLVSNLVLAGLSSSCGRTDFAAALVRACAEPRGQDPVPPQELL